jgi:hypothetical protein
VQPPDKTVIVGVKACKTTPGGQPQVWDPVTKACVDAKDVTPWARYVVDARGLLDSAKEKLWQAIWWSFIPGYGNQKAYELCTEAIDIGRHILDMAAMVKTMGGEGQSEILEEAGDTVVFYGELFRWLTGIPGLGGFAALLIFAGIGYWRFTVIRARLMEDKVRPWDISAPPTESPGIVPAPGQPRSKPSPGWDDKVKTP